MIELLLSLSVFRIKIRNYGYRRSWPTFLHFWGGKWPQTTVQYRCLKDFRGSDEEVIAKRVLGSITTQIHYPSPTFLNLVIRNCNAVEGTPFTEASVYLQLSYESREAFRTKFRDGYPKCGMVYIKDILNKSILQEFVEHGVAAIEKHSDVCQEAFLTLLKFLRGQRKHEKALHKLFTVLLPNNGNKEMHVMAGLAHHLFSQLMPGKKYEMNKDVKQLPKECGCGCKAKIYEGNTSIGSQATWHGRVDILLNHTIPVSFGKTVTSSNDDDDDDDEDDDEDDEDDGDTDKEEPQAKQRKVEADNSYDIDNALLESKVLKQILAEAITNGFAQINRNRDTLSNLCIPTFGTTSEHVTVCLYDAENDCLLHIMEPLELWCPEEMLCYSQLNVTTKVIIWLFLNFTIFTQNNLCNALDLDKSGLHDELKECLEYYRNTKVGGNFVSQTTVALPWKYVTPLPKTRIT